jgi:hypothetical protein
MLDERTVKTLLKYSLEDYIRHMEKSLLYSSEFKAEALAYLNVLDDEKLNEYKKTLDIHKAKNLLKELNENI